MVNSLALINKRSELTKTAPPKKNAFMSLNAACSLCVFEVSANICLSHEYFRVFKSRLKISPNSIPFRDKSRFRQIFNFTYW